MLYKPERERGSNINRLYDGSLGSPELRALFDEMDANSLSPGRSDFAIRNVLGLFCANLRPRRVLEIGCHIGFGAIMMGNILRANRYGKVITLEPNPRFRAYAQRNIEKSGLTDIVEILPYPSTDENCQELLKAEAPFELVFVDGVHEYDATTADIELSASLIHDNGIIVLHDVGRKSAEIDKTEKGGARKALHDFEARNPEYKALFLEHPLYVHPCGCGLLTRQVYDPPID